MRYAEVREQLDKEDTPVDLPEASCKYRLLLRKDDRARFVSHLEYITVLTRAARRAKLPLRFSGGFHPQPKLSFSDALPTGVASDVEIIDIELSRQYEPADLATILNRQLPDGFFVLTCEQLYWKTPSPSASIESLVYSVPIAAVPSKLATRIQTFLKSASVPFTRRKKNRGIEVDLRPDVMNIEINGQHLELTLKKGSPFGVIAWLLEIDEAEARQLEIRKTAVKLLGEDN